MTSKSRKIIAILIFSFVLLGCRSPERGLMDFRSMSIDDIHFDTSYKVLAKSLQPTKYKISSGRGFVQFDAKTETCPVYTLVESNSGAINADSLPKMIVGCSLKSADFVIRKGDSPEKIWKQFPNAKRYEDSGQMGIMVVYSNASLSFVLTKSDRVSRIAFQRF